MERNFFAFVDADGQNIFINAEQIRQVTLSPNGCEIWFSETHRITLTGIGMAGFLERIGERAIALNGEPINLSRKP